VTIDTSNDLRKAFDSATAGSKLEAMVKSIIVTPPETAHEKQDLLGVDTNSFQNAFLDEKPVGYVQDERTGTIFKLETFYSSEVFLIVCDEN